MKRSADSEYLEGKFERLKDGKFWVAVWKDSIDPKVELLLSEPDPKFWFFIGVEPVDPPDGNVHTMPEKDREHTESKDCWCGPILSDDFTAQGGCLHYLHNEPC